jgi:hypothetical protein
MKFKALMLAAVAAGFTFAHQSAFAAPCDAEWRALRNAEADVLELEHGNANNAMNVREDEILLARRQAEDAYEYCMDRHANRDIATPGQIIDFGMGAFNAITGGSGSHGHPGTYETHPGHSGTSPGGGFWIGPTNPHGSSLFD